LVKVRIPFVLKVSPAVKFNVFEPVIAVKLLKVIAGLPEPASTDVPAPSIVTVPELWVKVPLLVIFPAIVNNAEGGAVNVPFVSIRKSPLTSTVGLLVFAVTFTLFVPFPIVRVFEIIIVCDAPVPRVIVGAAATAGAIVRL
jgi:hypothetical protein